MFRRNISTLLFAIVITITWITILKYILSSKVDRFQVKYVEVPRSRKSFVDVEYLLESLPCTSTHRLVMIITSYAGHDQLRSAHRRALSQDYLDGVGIKRVFLLAKLLNEKEITQGAIENEHLRFGDIIQGDFIESYRNLTYKHIMGLRWASTRCSDTRMIMKMDDDIVFNIHTIIEYVNNGSIEDRNNFLTGYVLKGMKPIRLKSNKWYVTKYEYSKSFYPPFLSGWMYFTTSDTAKILVDAARTTPLFWIDDVFVSGVLASKSGIKLKDLKFKRVFLEYYELIDCCLNDMIEKNIMCEYSVGPNGNDVNMIVKFNEAINNCIKNRCAVRSKDRSLNNTCVSVKKSFPIHNGNAIISVHKL